MEFGVLGPLTVTARDGAVDLGGPRQRRLLAALIANANHVISSDRLIDIVFEGDPPAAAPTTIRTYVARLRRSLDASPNGGLVVTESPGYVLRIDRDHVDAERFEAAVETGRRQLADNDPVGAATLRTALRMWRGPAFDEFAHEDWVRAEAVRLDELRVLAQEELNEALLACGLAHDVVAEAQRLIEQHPLRDRLRSQLAVALYRAGRQVEALRGLESYAQELAEVGLEPSAGLRALTASIAAHDPALRLDAPAGQPLRGYRIGASLGEGRHGVVYRAVQPGVGREVAVKTIRAQLANDPHFVRRFDAEAQLVAHLEHPHIVPIYDYWREPEGAYIVMRLLDGNLDEMVARGPCDVGAVAAMAQQLGGALSTAHGAGVVHGDIKPSNVLVDADNVYLADFGVAALTGHDATGTSPPSSGYESPETLAGGPPAPTSDQFALAVLFVQLLTGVLPFGTRAIATRHDRLPAIHVQRPSVPAAVDDVLRKATAWRPEERYPDVATFVDQFVAALRGEAGTARVVAAPANPYKGLRAFAEADSRGFFGREPAVRKLLARLGGEGPAARFVAVVGPSGSGKSSVVRAGLLPRLRAGALPGSAEWFIATMVPGSQPFAELEAALRAIALHEASPRPHDPVQNPVLRSLRAAVPEGQPVVLVIDQLEELFTLVTDEGVRRSFVDGLAAAVADPDAGLRVVATLRADFYDRPLRYHQFGQLMSVGTSPLVGMSASELEEAVTRPAAGVGIEVEPALATQIVADVVDQPAALPLLQFTLTELFEHRTGPVLTAQSYRDLGGVDAAVARRADAVYEQLAGPDRELVRRLFLRLVAVDDSQTVSSHRSLRADLFSLGHDAENMERVVDAFGQARLLVFDRDPVSRAPTVEVAHEALIQHWPRLTAWIADAGEGLRIQRRLAEAAREWDRQGRDEGDLYRGLRLESAIDWVERHAEAASPVEQAFVAASKQQRENEAVRQRRTNRRLRTLLSGVAVALVVALVAGFVAVGQRNAARRQSTVATVRELAAASAASLAADPELSILLALEAIEAGAGTVLPEAEQALHDAVLGTRTIARLQTASGGIADFAPGGESFLTIGGESGALGEGTALVIWSRDTMQPLVELIGHTAQVGDAAFSADGARVISTGGEDHTVRIWNATTGEVERIIDLGPETWAGVPVFSNDGTRFAVTLWDVDRNVTRVIDVGTGELVWELPAPPGTRSALNVEFSPDDRILAVSYFTGPGGTPGVRTWDLATGELLKVYAGHESDVTDVGFTPDGARLVTSGSDATARVFDVASGEELGAYFGHDSQLRDIEVANDGTKVATSGYDVHVWDIETLETLATIPGDTGFVDGLAFSPDGELLLTSSYFDQTSLLSDLTPYAGHEVHGLPGPETTLRSSNQQLSGFSGGVTVFSDDTRFAAGGDPGRVAVWEMATGGEISVLDAPGEPLNSMAYSSDGRLLAAAGSDGVRVWDADTFEPIARIEEGVVVNEVAFDPAGDGVLVAGAGGTALRSPAGDLVVRFGELAAYAAGFSHDGRLVAVASIDEFENALLHVLDAADGSPVAELPIDEVHSFRVVQDLAFSPDGALLATGSDDSDVVMWDAGTYEPVARLEGHLASVASVAFDPARNELASASTDGTIRIWDLETGSTRLTLSSGGATDIAYTSDGRYLVAVADAAVIVYALEVEELVRLAQERLTRTWTEAECLRYLSSRECPRES